MVNNCLVCKYLGNDTFIAKTTYFCIQIVLSDVAVYKSLTWSPWVESKVYHSTICLSVTDPLPLWPGCDLESRLVHSAQSLHVGFTLKDSWRFLRAAECFCATPTLASTCGVKLCRGALCRLFTALWFGCGEDRCAPAKYLGQEPSEKLSLGSLSKTQFHWFSLSELGSFDLWERSQDSRLIHGGMMQVRWNVWNTH